MAQKAQGYRSEGECGHRGGGQWWVFYAIEHFGLHHHSDSVMIKSFGRISRNSNRADPQFGELIFYPSRWLPPRCLAGLPGGKESASPCRRRERRGFDPWVGNILWSRN